MADIGRKRVEIANTALNQILGEMIEKKASVVRIFTPDYTINSRISRRRIIVFTVPSCIDDMVGYIKRDAALNPNNLGFIQVGNMKPRWMREFFLPLYILVKVIPGEDKSEEIRLHIA